VDLKISTSGGAPIYLQIVDQIKRSVAVGRLKPEDPLPSVRQLARELTINPNTVARAYLELEHQGFIYKRHGQGTYVCTPVLGAARRERNRMIAGLFETAISEAVNFGMSASEITAIYDQMMRRYELETV
jgi:GntR family transcriptional regulator